MSDHDPSYAPKLTSLLRRSQRTPRTFIDAGACRGDFTALLVSEFEEAAVHAFEPNPELSSDLAQRFEGDSRVRIWNLALHERTGRSALHVHADPGTSSLLDRPASERRYYHSSDRVVATLQVATTTLDAFIDAHAGSGVALLKLDTQGSELAILRGARRALDAAAIDVIYTEFFVVPHYAGAPLLGDLLGLLGQHGYSMFDLFKGPNAANGQLRFGDAIFLSPTFRARHVDTSPDEG
jgi:FkbM family methyltransferase